MDRVLTFKTVACGTFGTRGSSFIISALLIPPQRSSRRRTRIQPRIRLIPGCGVLRSTSFNQHRDEGAEEGDHEEVCGARGGVGAGTIWLAGASTFKTAEIRC
jgi:hypothetical protein